MAKLLPSPLGINVPGGDDGARSSCSWAVLSEVSNAKSQHESEIYLASFWLPSEVSWSEGDREIACFAYEGDLSKITGSPESTGATSDSSQIAIEETEAEIHCPGLAAGYRWETSVCPLPLGPSGMASTRSTTSRTSGPRRACSRWWHLASPYRADGLPSWMTLRRIRSRRS